MAWICKIPNCHCANRDTALLCRNFSADISTPPTRDPLLVEREKTHGPWKDTAKTFDTIMHTLNGSKLNSAQTAAMVMIFMKIARIHNGNPFEKDHWLDIAGYAKLGAEACE